ncbi:SigE family RNA polymerase sigma factor, partial [Micromonospora sp. NPDC049523]
MTVTTGPGVDASPPVVPAGEGDPGRPERVEFDAFYHAHFRSMTVHLCAYTGDLGQAQDLV